MSIDDQVPAAFIITGPDIAAQDLLFEQLSETLQRDSPSRFVRLRSSEASSLKTILKRIIQATTAISSENGSDEVQVGEVGNEVLATNPPPPLSRFIFVLFLGVFWPMPRLRLGSFFDSNIYCRSGTC